MAKLTKYRKDARTRVQRGQAYPVEEAFGLVKDLARAKFSESVDVAVNLGVDPRRSDQMVRGSTVLPNGTGKMIGEDDTVLIREHLSFTAIEPDDNS